jgi:hypothetical protein
LPQHSQRLRACYGSRSLVGQTGALAPLLTHQTPAAPLSAPKTMSTAAALWLRPRVDQDGHHQCQAGATNLGTAAGRAPQTGLATETPGSQPRVSRNQSERKSRALAHKAGCKCCWVPQQKHLASCSLVASQEKVQMHPTAHKTPRVMMCGKRHLAERFAVRAVCICPFCQAATSASYN